MYKYIYGGGGVKRCVYNAIHAGERSNTVYLLIDPEHLCIRSQLQMKQMKSRLLSTWMKGKILLAEGFIIAINIRYLDTTPCGFSH